MHIYMYIYDVQLIMDKLRVVLSVYGDSPHLSRLSGFVVLFVACPYRTRVCGTARSAHKLHKVIIVKRNLC